MVWNWMGDAFGWTTPSQREPTPPLLGCTWVDPPSPGMMIAVSGMTDMMTGATTGIMVSLDG